LGTARINLTFWDAIPLVGLDRVPFFALRFCAAALAFRRLPRDFAEGIPTSALRARSDFTIF